MQNVLFGIVVGINMYAATARAAECGPCPRAEQLVAGWAAADTPERRVALIKDSFVFLRKQITTANTTEEIGAVVRTLGAVYARDYDPLNDLLSLYRTRLSEPDYRRTFDEEVERLPGEARDKLKQGLSNLTTRPRCQGRGKSYRCTDN